MEEQCHIQGFAEAAPEMRKRDMIWRLVARNILSLYRKLVPARSRYGDKSEYEKPKIEPLQLQAGERVRVKSVQEIALMLDKDNKFQGLSFFAPMEKYCGGTFTVLRRVERVFNERRWKMSKVRNVVLLEEVFCDGKGGIEKSWDGCERNCYLWWKEAWLERVND